MNEITNLRELLRETISEIDDVERSLEDQLSAIRGYLDGQYLQEDEERIP